MKTKLSKTHLVPFIMSCFLFMGVTLTAQTTLFYENFEGSTPKFMLNTTDVGCTAAADNIWIINNSYDGIASASAPCGFFSVNFGPRDTPEQDAAVSGNSRSKYMHINSKLAASQGVTNSMYIDPNPFFPNCLVPGNAFSKMSETISTSGYDNVELSFYWICRTNSKAFGEVYYSTNNGSSWTLITSPKAKYFGDSLWKMQTISNTAFDNQANLQFGFRWVNGYMPSGDYNKDDSILDPAFGVDEIKITGIPGTAPTLSQSYSPATVCAGATIQVPLTSTGAFSGNNNYKVELSDANGNFSNPVEIGSSQSSANSATVQATIPANTPGGTGYRIRVVSTAPALTSTPSAAFSINPKPTLATVTTLQNTVCVGTGTTLVFEGSDGTIKWESSTNGQNFTLIPGQSAIDLETGALVQDTWFRATVENNCGSLTSEPLKISIESTVIMPATQVPGGEIDLCVTKVTLTIPNIYTSVVWSTGRSGNVITITQPGTYYATGISPSGCAARTIDYTYTKSPEPIAGFTYTQPFGYTIQFTNTSQNGVTYEWFFENDTSILENPTHAFPFDDTYPVKLVVTNSCGTDTMIQNVVVEKFVSVNDLPGVRNISVFPVPSSNQAFIRMQKSNSSPVVLELLDVTGRILHKESVTGQGEIVHTINLEQIASGTYLLNVRKDGAVATLKIIRK